MGRRESNIANSITYSILHSDAKKLNICTRLGNCFHTHWLSFICVREDLFETLRSVWLIKDANYRKSFGAEAKGKDALSPMGRYSPSGSFHLCFGPPAYILPADMGFSGSTFFVTKDSAYLVKSVPRYFEHSFFRDDLLVPYTAYMQSTPNSLLIRITDFLECAHYSIGSMLGLAPSHHIVMENILYGQEDSNHDDADHESWQSWDLKPMSYFYPERDVAGGALTSESTKAKLADSIEDTIDLTLDDAEALKAQLEKDTALLAKHNAVDYSLFLVRIPTSDAPDACSQPSLSTNESGRGPIPPAEPPFIPPSPPSWRIGVKSADGRYIYRAAILDFFWAKHKVHAMAMTGLIKTYNLIDRQGPMSVTTTSPEYRQRFLKMCVDLIEVPSGVGPSSD